MNKPFALAAIASALTLTHCRAPQPAAVSAVPPPAAAATPAPGTPKEYRFQEVAGDPLKTRIYTLDNGLTVYLSDYKNAPRIQTYIAVRAGSKNDPSTDTGLAHYLEHILFKGTTSLGTQDWETEKVELAKIEALYNLYRTKTDGQERARIYHQIDSISGVAAKLAVANEYDKMMSEIGARGTNAHTSVEETVYQEDIPANEVKRWAKVQAERFRHVVPRLFHTELEAVYEEKNRGLDSDGNKQFEMLLAELFKKHEYGTQTTIGTIEHLKNPSITAIKKYFDAYYVPNNVAITMSGDLDYDQTIRLIDEYFGSWKPNPALPVYVAAQEAPITAPIERTVVGPEAENLLMGFRLPGQLHKDALALRMIDRLMTNGQAGLIDLNLNQQQKTLGAFTGLYANNDYSVAYMGAGVRSGQTLPQVRDLLLGQLEKVKKGEFADWLMPAIVTNERLNQQKQFQNNTGRASAMYGAFIARQPWADFLSEDERFARLTKQEVVEVANRYFGQNYVAVYKKVGADKTTEKVVKPAITPVPVNRAAKSTFAANVMAEVPPSIEPQFLNYQKDIARGMLKTGAEVLSTRNTENKLFSLAYVFDVGTDANPRLGMALDYLKFLGDDKHSAAELQQEFYKLGCTFDVYAAADQTRVSLTGPDEGFDQGLALFEYFIRHPKPDAAAWQKQVAGVLKDRADSKRNKRLILQAAMINYAKYGARNPFTNLVSEKELKTLKPAALLAEVSQLLGTQHRVLYYGPRPVAALTATVDNVRAGQPALKPAPAVKEFAEREIVKPVVYWANYDMVQAEMVFLTRAQAYDKALVPTVALYNEYFGGGMGSIVFQELRESKALAYSTYSNYALARTQGRSNYIQSYIGAQADKLPEAMAGMEALLNEMPLAEANFSTAKASIRSNIAADRITREGILYSYESARRLGLDYDIRQDIYAQAATMSFEDLKRFQQQNVRQKPQAVLVVGDKKRLNFQELAKYGTVKELTLTELFGY